MKIKRYLVDVLDNFLSPIRKRREEFAKDPEHVMNIAFKGTEVAEKIAAKTMTEMFDAIGLIY